MEEGLLTGILISWLPAVLILVVLFWVIRALISMGRSRSETLALSHKQLELLERIAAATEKLAASDRPGQGKKN